MKKTLREITTAERLRDLSIRAAKTFVQAFAASLTIDATTIAGGPSIWRAALISATAAGISAVMNFFLICLEDQGGSEDEKV